MTSLFFNESVCNCGVMYGNFVACGKLNIGQLCQWWTVWIAILGFLLGFSVFTYKPSTYWGLFTVTVTNRPNLRCFIAVFLLRAQSVLILVLHLSTFQKTQREIWVKQADLEDKTPRRTGNRRPSACTVGLCLCVAFEKLTKKEKY